MGRGEFTSQNFKKKLNEERMTDDRYGLLKKVKLFAGLLSVFHIPVKMGLNTGGYTYALVCFSHGKFRFSLLYSFCLLVVG